MYSSINPCLGMWQHPEKASIAGRVASMTACCLITMHPSTIPSSATMTALSKPTCTTNQKAKLQLLCPQTDSHLDTQTDKQATHTLRSAGHATWHYHHLLFFQLVQNLICILDASTQLQPSKHAGLRLLPFSQTCQVLLCNRPVYVNVHVHVCACVYQNS